MTFDQDIPHLAQQCSTCSSSSRWRSASSPWTSSPQAGTLCISWTLKHCVGPAKRRVSISHRSESRSLQFNGNVECETAQQSDKQFISSSSSRDFSYTYDGEYKLKGYADDTPLFNAQSVCEQQLQQVLRTL